MAFSSLLRSRLPTSSLSANGCLSWTSSILVQKQTCPLRTLASSTSSTAALVGRNAYGARNGGSWMGGSSFGPFLSRAFSSMHGGVTPAEKRNIRDHKRRLLAEKYELRRKLYKALCKDPELPSDMRDKHRYKLSKLPRNSSFVRVRNRCIFTGRSRGVYQMFRMSRIVFRGLANQGALNGVKKASW